VATHRNLQEQVKQGLFRDDLYYRLAVFPIHMPPLRERKQDLPGLCEILSAQISRELKVQPLRLSAAALEKLRAYSFPGNIRELRNLLERAHILAQGPEIEDVPLAVEFTNGSGVHPQIASWIDSLPQSLDIREVLTEVERSLLQRALDRADGVQAEAARMLNLSRSDFGYKVAKYSLSR
jgi:DNA-binding NtrC family response regulator